MSDNVIECRSPVGTSSLTPYFHSLSFFQTQQKSVRFQPKPKPKPKRKQPTKAELDYRDSTLVFDYDDDEEDKKSDGQEEPEREKTPPALMAKVQEFLAKAPSPPVSKSFVYISCNMHELILQLF